MDTNKLNLDAYYYSFEPTGVDAVDTILSAVANAGAGYHNTEDWREQADDGSSPLSEMQAAAEKSAEAFRALIAENKGQAKKIKWDESWYGTRFETLFHWAHRELNEEQKTQYFNIVDNGSSSPLDPPTYAQQMNSLKWKVEAAEKERDMLKVEIERLRTAEGDAMTYKAGMENVAQQRDQLKQENRLLTEHNEFLASSGSRLEPELRAVKDALGLDFTASVAGEVVPAIEAMRKDAERLRWLRDSSQYDWDVSYGKLEIRIETPHDDSSDLDACIDAAMSKADQ